MFLIGLSMTTSSITFLTLIFCAREIIESNPNAYRYAKALNTSTVGILVMLLVIIAIVGVSLMILGWIKRKNKAILDSIKNQTCQNYCTNCCINVETNNEQCPLCGKKLRGE